VIDLSEECIDACKKRFAGSSHIDYHVNDGKSLEMIPDASVDFVFSFDSLVHADAASVKAYISQLPRILTEDGAAFIHHSNLGEYKTTYSGLRSIPKVGGLLTRLGILEQLHWRDPGVSAGKVEAFTEEHGLQCISQEIIPWGTKRMHIDCMSTIVKKKSSLERENRIVRNPRFMREAECLRGISRLYNLEKIRVYQETRAKE
jgi:hypothetical protein